MSRVASSRRDLFTRAWRDALAAAPKLGPFAAAEPPADEPPRFEPETIAAGPATGAVSEDELVARADAIGLARHADAIRSLALRSVRLTPGAGRSRVGGPCVAQIDLAEVAALGVESPLPAAGVLVFGDSVRLAPEPIDGEPSAPLDASAELSLPPAWSAAVDALGADHDERVRWQELRAWLAERQGVEMHDGTPDFLAVHRLLGYPDETADVMPSGERWRLLLQVSHEHARRTYFWIGEDDLAASDFAHVQVIAH
jgi:Domain of unknown function (DUF1963)